MRHNKTFVSILELYTLKVNSLPLPSSINLFMHKPSFIVITYLKMLSDPVDIFQLKY